ncbi:hypothetical protein NDN08_006281 [Rhodosorus marinus]|uniref:GOLD domain-containing protein n=1 Tax=Rhodosorus marinus TaxID=101924 RepID=A0AAV8ULS2_9RHOD|nr:hypothetical protein NDN08_006281 [Rhodosorus marinus]
MVRILLWGLVALACAELACVVRSHQFLIEDYKSHCYKESFAPGTDVRVEYIVAQGIGEAPPVDIEIKDVRGKVKVHHQMIDHGALTLTTETQTNGEGYMFCFLQRQPPGVPGLKRFQNRDKPQHRMITLKVHPVAPVKTYPELAREEDLLLIQKAISKAENRIESVLRLVERSRVSAGEVAELEEQTSFSVIALGVLSSVAIAFGGALQMYTTTRKLRHEKVI